MKFRFCGEADCPDWLLLQINTLSKMNSSQLQNLAEIVVQPLIGKDMDYPKLRDFSKAVGLDTNDIKACVSAVTQILKSGSCYAVSPEDLGQELEQLGLDRLHSQVIVKIYSKEKDEIKRKLKEKILRVGTLKEVTRVADETFINLNIVSVNSAGNETNNTIRMTPSQAHYLSIELKKIRSRMEELQGESEL